MIVAISRLPIRISVIALAIFQFTVYVVRIVHIRFRGLVCIMLMGAFAQAVEAQSVAAPEFFYAKPGPWGKLKCFYVYLEPPLETIAALPLPETKVHWDFPIKYATQLGSLFDKAGLPQDVKQRLLDPENLVYGESCISLFVSLTDLESMTATARETIYAVLATFPTNTFYAHPILITTETVEEWFRNSKLSPQLVSKVKNLSYRKGACIAFSDVSALMNYVTTDDDARRSVKAMFRTRSIMIQVELKDEQNINQLLDYWSSDVYERRKDIEPILRSIAAAKDVDHLGLSHLLPSNVRKLIYTFPRHEPSFNAVKMDCHWTSINFFNFEPLDYSLDSPTLLQFVQDKYDHVGELPNQYGDLVLLHDRATSRILHSCNYLADDMVYTKAGQSEVSPWVILKLSEVKKLFSHIQMIDTTSHRLKRRN